DAFYISCFAWLVKDARWRYPLILTSILAIPILSQDAFLFSVPFLLALVLFKLNLRAKGALDKASTRIFLVFAFACLGLLPLIKGTMLMAAVGYCVVCAMFLALERHRFLALNCVVTPTISMALLWVISGQRLSALPGFFMSIKLIISGYSEAMAFSG